MSVPSSSVKDVVHELLKFYGPPPERFFAALDSMEPQRSESLQKMRASRRTRKSLGRALRLRWNARRNVVLPVEEALAFAKGLMAWTPGERFTAQHALDDPFLEEVRDPTDEPRRLGLIDPHRNHQHRLDEWKGIGGLLHFVIWFLSFILWKVSYLTRFTSLFVHVLFEGVILRLVQDFKPSPTAMNVGLKWACSSCILEFSLSNSQNSIPQIHAPSSRSLLEHNFWWVYLLPKKWILLSYSHLDSLSDFVSITKTICCWSVRAWKLFFIFPFCIFPSYKLFTSLSRSQDWQAFLIIFDRN